MDYDDNDILLCPICAHVLEDVEAMISDPCMHVVARYVSDVGDWDILAEELQELWCEAEDEDEDITPEEWAEKVFKDCTVYALVSGGGPVSSEVVYVLQK